MPRSVQTSSRPDATSVTATSTAKDLARIESSIWPPHRIGLVMKAQYSPTGFPSNAGLNCCGLALTVSATVCRSAGGEALGCTKNPMAWNRQLLSSGIFRMVAAPYPPPPPLATGFGLALPQALQVGIPPALRRVQALHCQVTGATAAGAGAVDAGAGAAVAACGGARFRAPQTEQAAAALSPLIKVQVPHSQPPPRPPPLWLVLACGIVAGFDGVGPRPAWRQSPCSGAARTVTVEPGSSTSATSALAEPSSVVQRGRKLRGFP